MCSSECFKWTARNISQEEIEGKRVLEVGAYDVNGANINDADFKSPVFLKSLVKYKLKMAGLSVAKRVFRQV